MAVRSKMSATRSRRAVVTSTSSKDDLPTKKYTETSAVTTGSSDKSIANITPEDDKLIRQQMRINPNEDYTINESTYKAWKDTGKRNPKDFLKDFRDGKVKTNPYSNVYDGDPTGDFTPQIYEKNKAPKPTSNKNNASGVVAKEQINKLKLKPAFDSKKTGTDIDLKQQTNKDVMVPKMVEGPKARAIKGKKIEYTPGAVGGQKRTITGKLKFTNKPGKLAVVDKPIPEKMKTRVSERMKYKKELLIMVKKRTHLLKKRTRLECLVLILQLKEKSSRDPHRG
jgi:hypothetical protein